MSLYKSHRAAPARVFDHLYDPIYTMSGARDVWRNNRRSLATSAQVEIYPVYRTMFTDLPWRPRNYYVPLSNPLPRLSTRADAAPPAHCAQRAAGSAGLGVVVTGADRAKFFGQPISNAKTLTLRLHLDTDCVCIPAVPPVVEPWQTRACQTDYRVQSAQTVPYMPEAVICEQRPDTPELVHVAELLRGDDGENAGLPGIYEAEVVARARKRREWEKSLPAIATWEDWERRRIVLEAFEWEEWIGRENRIEYCQRLRLGIVQRLMHERKQKQKRECVERVDTTRQRLEAQRDKRLEQLRIKHRRRLRQLDSWHRQVPAKYLPVDVTTEHIDHSSALYAPPARFGPNPKHRHFVPFPTDYVPKLDGQKEPLLMKKPPESKRKTTNEELRDLYESLKLLRGHRTLHHENPKCLRYVRRESSIVMDTPKLSAESVDDEQENQMVLFVQKLLKGRAIQKKLYSGRNKCRELIAEFQTSHQLTDIRTLNQAAQRPNRLTEDRKSVHYQQMRLAALLRAEAQIKEVTGQAVSTTISFALDLLESEMIRLVDQKKAQALCMLAESERYRREAIEAGNRQRGDNRRRFHDEVSRSCNLSRQNTVCAYLENVLVECLDKVAEQEARSKIRATVQRIDEAAQSANSAVVVADVLDRFVLPDVFRHIAHENHLADVHSAFFGDMLPDMIEEQRRQRMNRFLEAAVVSPRDSSRSPSESSRVSALSVSEDAAHHEAMHCIRRVLAKAMRPTAKADHVEAEAKAQAKDAQDGMVTSILDEIVQSAPADGVSELSKGVGDDEGGLELLSARSSVEQQQQLTAIVKNVNDALWEYAKRQSAETAVTEIHNEDDDAAAVIDPVGDEKMSQLHIHEDD